MKMNKHVKRSPCYVTDLCINNFCQGTRTWSSVTVKHHLKRKTMDNLFTNRKN